MTQPLPRRRVTVSPGRYFTRCCSGVTSGTSPIDVARSVYGFGARLATVKPPSSPVVVWNRSPSGAWTSTCAPANGWPSGPRTRPEIAPAPGAAGAAAAAGTGSWARGAPDARAAPATDATRARARIDGTAGAFTWGL